MKEFQRKILAVIQDWCLCLPISFKVSKFLKYYEDKDAIIVTCSCKLQILEPDKVREQLDTAMRNYLQATVVVNKEKRLVSL